MPRLGAREQFSIATPDVQVIVHGTVFSVRFGSPGQPHTCVRVSEGLVEVRHRGGSVHLGAGTQWGCETAPPATPASAARAATALRLQKTEPERAPARLTASTPRRSTPPQTQSGTLDAENALLTAALTAERAHDRVRALALFSELLARHPGSPLVPDARAGVARTR